MQNEIREADMRVENAGTVNCPNCGVSLVAGLRFCRMCGYRLGEGVEEYVATQRLDANAPTAAQAAARATDPFAARTTWNPAPPQAFGTNSLAPRDSSGVRTWASACNPRRGGWMLWLVLMIALLTALSAVTKSVRNRVAGGGRSAQGSSLPANSISKEVDDFDTADGGGAFIEGLSAPDTSLERAGIIGGDIITSFDGKSIPDEDTMRKVLAVTPPGKAVEVVYIHDGETKRTILTTIAEKDFRDLDVIDSRPGGRGVLGLISRVDLRRVRVPNSNIYGVQLGRLELNGPADLAGLKRGDIVTDFDGKQVRTPGDLRLRIYEAIPNSIVSVVLIRDGQRLEIPVKMGRGKAD